MATGISKRERYGEEALVASRQHFDPYPLPEVSANIELSYKGKISELDILRPVSCAFSSISQKGKIASVKGVEPNAFVLADNYCGLHDLLISGKRATLCYLDPPYCTGADFHSREMEHAYKDNFSPVIYLEYMRRRLILIRECLNENGSVYVHIGHQMVAQIKILMDEIFGSKNFRNLIVRKKCSSKNFTKNQYPNMNDYILFYTKTTSYKWRQPSIKPDDEWINKEYTKEDVRGRYKLVPVHAPGTRHGETGSLWRGMSPPKGKHWQYAPSKLDELDERGEIHWSKNGNPRRKVYLTKDKAVSLSDYWDLFRDAHHQSTLVTGYPTEKNLDMLKLIVGASSEEGDLVIDPFCGSGTTLHASRELGRQWIGMDQSFIAARATITRLRHGMKPMGDYVDRAENATLEMNLFDQLPIVQNRSRPNSKADDDFMFLVDDWLFSEYLADVLSVAKI